MCLLWQFLHTAQPCCRGSRSAWQCIAHAGSSPVLHAGGTVLHPHHRQCGTHWVTHCALQTPAQLEIHCTLAGNKFSIGRSVDTAAAESWRSPDCRVVLSEQGGAEGWDQGCAGKRKLQNEIGVGELAHRTRSHSRWLVAALLKAPETSRAAGQAALTHSSAGLTDLQNCPEDVAGGWQLSIFTAQLSPALTVHPCQAGRAKAHLCFSCDIWAAGLCSGMAHPGHGGHGSQPSLCQAGNSASPGATSELPLAKYPQWGRTVN